MIARKKILHFRTQGMVALCRTRLFESRLTLILSSNWFNRLRNNIENTIETGRKQFHRWGYLFYPKYPATPSATGSPRKYNSWLPYAGSPSSRASDFGPFDNLILFSSFYSYQRRKDGKWTESHSVRQQDLQNDEDRTTRQVIRGNPPDTRRVFREKIAELKFVLVLDAELYIVECLFILFIRVKNNSVFEIKGTAFFFSKKTGCFVLLFSDKLDRESSGRQTNERESSGQRPWELLRSREINS